MDRRRERMNQFFGLMLAFADRVDEVIYHYTSAEGLRGIVENSEVWLTNVHFVNDTSECRALQEEKDLFNDGDLTNNYVKDSWGVFINKPGNDIDTYIASFSRGEESLEQWRAYGNYRIGFEANKLLSRRFNLYQSVYTREEIKKWILEKSKAKEWKGDYLNDEYKKAAAFNLIYAASKKYKNVHFKQEKEVRIIVVSPHTWGQYSNSSSMFEDDPLIHYRDHTTYKAPVPYVKLIIADKEEQDNKKLLMPSETSNQMKKRKLIEERAMKRSLLPIKDILIGPILHQKKAEIACKILLNDKGYENVKVNVSEIPYRGF